MRYALVVSILALAAISIIPPADAQSSCSGFQSKCAQRCKERNPNDKNCVSDHCTPKLGACRSTGCWQEGQLYGGQKTCNLKKS